MTYYILITVLWPGRQVRREVCCVSQQQCPAIQGWRLQYLLLIIRKSQWLSRWEVSFELVLIFATGCYSKGSCCKSMYCAVPRSTIQRSFPLRATGTPYGSDGSNLYMAHTGLSSTALRARKGIGKVLEAKALSR